MPTAASSMLRRPQPPPRPQSEQPLLTRLPTPSQPLRLAIESTSTAPAVSQHPPPPPTQRHRSESSTATLSTPPQPLRVVIHQATTKSTVHQYLSTTQRSQSDSPTTACLFPTPPPRLNIQPTTTTPTTPQTVPALPPRRPQSRSLTRESTSTSSYSHSPNSQSTNPAAYHPPNPSIPPGRHSAERRSTSSVAAGSSAPTLAPSTPPRHPSPDSQFSFDGGRSSGGFRSLFARGKKDKRNGDLCGHCAAKIDFEQFASGEMRGLNGVPRSAMGPTTTALLSLFDIMEKSGPDGQGCPFCNLLLDAMTMPEHDPFQHPAIRDHMPNGFEEKTFDSWVKGLRGQSWLDQKMNNTHPFGKSRNKVQIEVDKSNPDGITEVQRTGLEVKEQAALATSAAGAGAGITAASQSRSEAKTAVSAVGGVGGIINSGRLIFLNEKLPVAIRVKMHNIKDTGKQGLLNVSVYGYGCKVQAPLSVLSSFSLRVASDYQQDGLGLYYGRIMGEYVKVEEDCRIWLDNCCQHHGEQCANPDWYTKLPLPWGRHFRLIEIDDRRGVMFKVVKVAAMMTAVPEYAALSYVWGDAGRIALNLRENNIEELSRRIPPGRLAKTVADAIEVTRQLGLKYLWVDSLCIIQQDPRQKNRSINELEARQSQLDQMGSIFGHAKIVIVAAGGEDAGCGLAGISQPRKPIQIAQAVMPNVNVLLAAQYDESYGKWDTRAWTLQEKLMSRRMLVFDRNYVSFHCRDSVLREDMSATHAGNGPPAMPYLSIFEDRAENRAERKCNGSYVLLRSPYFDEYAKILEQYTWRERTESSDVISAMLGLLNVLEDMKRPDSQQEDARQQTPSRDRHRTLEGLPEEFLDLALLWQPPAVISTRLTRRENDSFPSWSWAGWKVSSRGGSYSGNGAACRGHTGVRFEQPFQVSGYDNMSLRKFIATGSRAEERVRPLVMWYKWVEGNLVPVNDSGLGIVCGEDAATWFFKDPLRLRNPARSQWSSLLPNVPPGTRLNGQHLICETQVRMFKLRQDMVNNKPRPRREVLWTHGVDGTAVVAKELDIVEAEILDTDGEVVGHVIPTDQLLEISAAKLYHFILLSVSQYWGNEKRIDVPGYPLYNIMMIEWDDANEVFATRLGLGKVLKAAWKAEGGENKCVILR